MNLTESFQHRLTELGLYKGKRDGDFGPLTMAAAIAWQRSLGNAIPPWMLVAAQELGMREIAGAKDNPRIIEYHRHTSLQASDDETPWCSSFENYCMDLAGLKGTNSAGAISWMDWGVSLKAPKFGAVAVFSRTGGNHVTNFVWTDGVSDSALYLGGNQGDAVSVEPIGKARLRGYRWPSVGMLSVANTHLVAAAKEGAHPAPAPAPEKAAA